jgi:hypothetical protein
MATISTANYFRVQKLTGPVADVRLPPLLTQSGGWVISVTQYVLKIAVAALP